MKRERRGGEDPFVAGTSSRHHASPVVHFLFRGGGEFSPTLRSQVIQADRDRRTQGEHSLRSTFPAADTEHPTQEEGHPLTTTLLRSKITHPTEIIVRREIVILSPPSSHPTDHQVRSRPPYAPRSPRMKERRSSAGFGVEEKSGSRGGKSRSQVWCLFRRSRQRGRLRRRVKGEECPYRDVLWSWQRGS